MNTSLDVTPIQRLDLDQIYLPEWLEAAHFGPQGQMRPEGQRTLPRESIDKPSETRTLLGYGIQHSAHYPNEAFPK